MQIFVDADACPVVDIVETIAEKYNISTTLLCDTNHILYSDYSDVIVVGAGADTVDYKLIRIMALLQWHLVRVPMQFISPASGTRMKILTGCLWKDTLIRKQDEVLTKII